MKETVRDHRKKKRGHQIQNSCPRCGGTMLFEEDMYGPYISCLVCGFLYDVDSLTKPEVDSEITSKGKLRHNPNHRTPNGIIKL